MTLLALLVAVTSCGKDAIPTAPAGPEQNRLVAQVIVEPGDALLSPDDTRQLTVVVKSARGQVVNGRSVTWSSLDESVARVDQSGTLFGANEGSAKVRATVEGVSGTATIDVRGQVVDVVFSQAPDELDEGEANQLSVTYVYSNGATRPAGRLHWSSLDRSIAAIDGEGLLLGTGEGTTAIEASGRGISSRRSFRIKKVPIKSVVVGGPTTTLTVGDSEPFWAEVYGPADKRLTRTVTWTSSNTSVATVDADGVVSAIASGQATISASVEGVTGSLLIHVASAGGSGGGSGGGAVTPPPGMVTDLRVTFPEQGWATLTFTEVDDGTGQPADYEVRYFDQGMQGRWGEAFTVTSGSCTAPVSGSGSGRTLSCSVGGLHASMSYEFQVVAFRGTLGQGAEFGSLSNIAGATTSAPAINVDVTPSSFTLDVGQARQLQADVLDSYGNAVEGSVIWTSSSSAVATVSNSGSASGVSAGNATLRATYQSSTSGTSAATVVQPSTGGGGSSGGSSGGSGVCNGCPLGSAQPGPNQPAGYTTFAAVEFNNIASNGLVDGGPLQEATPGGLNPQVPFTQSGFPNSPVMATSYPAGFQAGSAAGTRMFLRPQTNFAVREFYISWRGGVSSGFVGQAGGQFKAMGIRRSGNQAAWLDIHGIGTGPLEFRVDQKIGDYNRGDSGQRWLRPNRSTCRVTRGQVHFFEMNWQASAARGATNGVVRWWLDGVLCGEYTDVETVASPGLGTNGQVLCNCIEDIAVTPIWGGATGTTPNAFQYWIDDLYVSGR